jgi:hexosaminidase
VVPAPLLVEPHDGPGFTVSGATSVRVGSDSPAVRRIGEYLAAMLRPGPAGVTARADDGVGTEIVLSLAGDTAPGEEGYVLESAAGLLAIRAGTAAGLFRGVQTLRQLLPETVEVDGIQSGPWIVPPGRIVDRPRFVYRGVMLDVARYFFGVADVKRVIDLAALYKLNHLHLHLTDDQGWRIAIDSWPRLATYGGGTDVAGGPGGYYTQDDYREIVAYAAAHHMTVVPEIDLPGHTNAALASYPELTGDGRALDRYTGVEVGFSSLAAGNELTYAFLDDVFTELSGLTPGPYLHIGGDEAMATGAADYRTIVARVQEIVGRRGKTAIGWHEIAKADLAPSTVVQYWGVTPDADAVVAAAERGNKVILSPANRAYLDMQYDASSRVGQSWAGFVALADAYGWDPATRLPGLDPDAVLGLECPLWTETVRSVRDIEYLLLPRMPALAEVAWSPVTAHDWDGFRRRLADQAPRWVALGADFFASPDVPWSSVPRSTAHDGLEVEHLR